MSEKIQNEQDATASELTEESLESVAGGITGEQGAGCDPQFPDGSVILPHLPTF
jgi:hypothetical protein